LTIVKERDPLFQFKASQLSIYKKVKLDYVFKTVMSRGLGPRGIA